MMSGHDAPTPLPDLVPATWLARAARPRAGLQERRDSVRRFRSSSGTGTRSSPRASMRSWAPKASGSCAHPCWRPGRTHSRNGRSAPCVVSCLNRMLVLGRRQLETVLAGYVAHYNEHRPNRALGQAAPLTAVPSTAPAGDMRVVRVDRVGRLIDDYSPGRMTGIGSGPIGLARKDPAPPTA